MSLTAIGFLGVFVVLVVLAFVRHPVWGLYSYVWVFYNHPPARWWGAELPDLRLSLIAAIVTMVAMLLHRGSPEAPPAKRGEAQDARVMRGAPGPGR